MDGKPQTLSPCFSSLSLPGISIYSSILHMHGFNSAFIVPHHLLYKNQKHGCKVTSSRSGKTDFCMREKSYYLCFLWVYENLSSDGFQQAKQGYYVNSYFQDRLTGTKQAPLDIIQPKAPFSQSDPQPFQGWADSCLVTPPPHRFPGEAFLLLPSAATVQSSHWYSRGRSLALILKAISNYLASHLPLFSVTCALLAPTGVESFQQPLPFQRALQTAIYTLNRH